MARVPQRGVPIRFAAGAISLASAIVIWAMLSEAHSWFVIGLLVGPGAVVSLGGAIRPGLTQGWRTACGVVGALHLAILLTIIGTRLYLLRDYF